MSDAEEELKGDALRGKEFYEVARSPLGAPRKYDAPEELLEDCQRYFDWARLNPLYESKLVSFQGVSTIEEVPKIRALTLRGLCAFIGCSTHQWRSWRNTREDLSFVITAIEDAIYRQKFEAASADLLNANIISRDLGLANKEELSGPDGGPIKHETKDVSEEALIDQARRLGIDPAALGLGGGASEEG